LGSALLNEKQDWLADHLIRPVTVDRLGTGIPAGDDPVQRIGEDGVIRAVDYGCEQRMSG
jgi:hypothetical protein